jgi:hypothetical protein
MRSKSLSFALLAASLCCSTAAEIDLTPSVREYSSQGFVYRQVKLKQATQDILFVLPQGWEVRGGKDRLQLQPADKSFSEGVVSTNSLAAQTPFDETMVKALEQRVLSEAPLGSQNIQVLRREQNPVLLGSNPSLEIAISYATLGRTFERSVLFVHTPDTQLVFRFTAPKQDFAALNQMFRRSIQSWQWTERSDAATLARR